MRRRLDHEQLGVPGAVKEAAAAVHAAPDELKADVAAAAVDAAPDELKTDVAAAVVAAARADIGKVTAAVVQSAPDALKGEITAGAVRSAPDHLKGEVAGEAMKAVVNSKAEGPPRRKGDEDPPIWATPEEVKESVAAAVAAAVQAAPPGARRTVAVTAVRAATETAVKQAVAEAGSTGQTGEGIAPTAAEAGAGSKGKEHITATAAAAVEAAVAAAPSEMKDSVAAAAAGGVVAANQEVFAREISRAMSQAMAGPPLDNFNGHLSVRLLDNEDNDSPVPIDADGPVRLLINHSYQLVVAIGQAPQPDARTAPIRIRGGNDSPEVSFTVSVDTAALIAPTGLSRSEQTIKVGHGDGLAIGEGSKGSTAAHRAEGELRFPLLLSSPKVHPPWLLVRVTQHGRTIQNLELKLIAAEVPG